ncbi:MAG TPA: ABC transporter permease, partial [Acidimicrobiales bacterium]|nr:ABC transporter permease [Acidimicrobiales bacterium]
MRAVLRRVIQLVLVLFLVTLFTSFLIDAVPGDVTYTLAPVATPEQRENLRHELHLDRSPLERYGEWVSGVARGDLGCYYGTSGYSTASQCPDKVADRVKDALPISIALMFYAQLLALVIAIPMGVLTAYRAGTIFDKTVNTTAFALLAIPNFVLALVLAYYVGTKLGWVNPTGYIDFGQDPVGHFQQL